MTCTASYTISRWRRGHLCVLFEFSFIGGIFACYLATSNWRGNIWLGLISIEWSLEQQRRKNPSIIDRNHPTINSIFTTEFCLIFESINLKILFWMEISLAMMMTERARFFLNGDWTAVCIHLCHYSALRFNTILVLFIAPHPPSSSAAAASGSRQRRRRRRWDQSWHSAWHFNWRFINKIWFHGANNAPDFRHYADA